MLHFRASVHQAVP